MRVLRFLDVPLNATISDDNCLALTMHHNAMGGNSDADRAVLLKLFVKVFRFGRLLQIVVLQECSPVEVFIDNELDLPEQIPLGTRSEEISRQAALQSKRKAKNKTAIRPSGGLRAVCGARR